MTIEYVGKLSDCSLVKAPDMPKPSVHQRKTDVMYLMKPTRTSSLRSVTIITIYGNQLSKQKRPTPHNRKRVIFHNDITWLHSTFIKRRKLEMLGGMKL